MGNMNINRFRVKADSEEVKNEGGIYMSSDSVENKTRFGEILETPFTLIFNNIVIDPTRFQTSMRIEFEKRNLIQISDDEFIVPFESIIRIVE